MVELAVSPKVLVCFLSIFTVYVSFFEEHEISSKLGFDPLRYLFVRAWLLFPELVARECEDFETLVSILLVDFCQLRVVFSR